MLYSLKRCQSEYESQIHAIIDAYPLRIINTIQIWFHTVDIWLYDATWLKFSASAKCPHFADTNQWFGRQTVFRNCVHMVCKLYLITDSGDKYSQSKNHHT